MSTWNNDLNGMSKTGQGWEDRKRQSGHFQQDYWKTDIYAKFRGNNLWRRKSNWVGMNTRSIIRVFSSGRRLAGMHKPILFKYGQQVQHIL